MPQKSGFPFWLVLFAITAVFLAYIAGPKVALSPYSKGLPRLPEDLDSWLEQKESQIPDLRPELKKQIIWQSQARKKTALSLVYIHGFSASHKEIDPIPRQLLTEFGANGFLTRLKGHGRDGKAMGSVHYHDWLRDAEEALAIGKGIGEKVVAIGTSTGGSLVTWLAQHYGDELAGIVLISPNFGVKDKRSEIMLLPWGKAITRWVAGPFREFEAPNALVTRYWTPRYPTEALFPLMATVNLVRNLPVSRVNVPCLVLYAEKDQVVDVEMIKRFYKRLGSPVKKLVEIAEASGHVLAGDAWSPQSNERVKDEIANFIKNLEP